jgi:predicted nucleic acid-binding protein
VVTLVDSSALYAYLDARDRNHSAASDVLAELLESGDLLITHNYVVVETSALVQRRLGAEAVRSLFDDLLPIIEVRWIDEATHRLATSAMLGSLSRAVSLVDWTSFVVMREMMIDRAFAFDADFASQGLRTIPD